MAEGEFEEVLLQYVSLLVDVPSGFEVAQPSTVSMLNQCYIRLMWFVFILDMYLNLVPLHLIIAAVI